MESFLRKLWSPAGLSVIAISLVVACTDIKDSILGGDFLSFLKSFKEVKLTFPTNTVGETVTIQLKSRPGTIRPKLDTAIRFLQQNYSHTEQYKRDVYDCKQFAQRLFEDAQINNYESKFVIISLMGESEGHAVATIETSDAGRLFVDFTPFLMANGEQKPSRTVAFVQEGKPYIRIPLTSLGDNFRNQEQDFLAYLRHLKKSEGEVSSYNDEIGSLENKKRKLEARIAEFKDRANRSINSSNYEKFRAEERQIQDEVNYINQQYDILNIREKRLRNNYSNIDWIGKNWIVDKVRIVP